MPSAMPNRQQELIESKEVLKSLLCNLTQSQSRLWMTWNQGMSSVMSGTRDYTQLSNAEEDIITNKWYQLIENIKDTWENIVKEAVIRAEDIDDQVESGEDYGEIEVVDGVYDELYVYDPDE